MCTCAVFRNKAFLFLFLFLLVRLFENAQKKILVVKNAILAVFGSYVLTVFSAFLKILTKTTFVCLLFLKLKQKKKFKNN